VVAAAILYAVVSGHVAHAQAPGVITGTVLDSTCGAIPGASVTLHSAAGERHTSTDASGGFVFEGVPSGPLTISATFDGFAPARVALNGPRHAVDVVLQPVPVTEALTVHAPIATALRTSIATKTDAVLRDVPQSVSVLTQDLIADQLMQSLADAVEYVPGVGMAQGEGHRDAPIFRGNTSTADFLVDGVRDDTQYLRDLYNVERVEVLKGPNGMIFGRGGAGGVINRVTRQADWSPSREVVLQAGSWGHRRLTADLGHALNPSAALRVTGLYENSGTYRSGMDIERQGVNPTIAVALGSNTMFRAGYEFFRDERTVDRGVPSFQGLPLDTDPSTFFGSTDVNRSTTAVHALSSTLEHSFSQRLTVRNRLTYADYDKFYQNLVPGAVNTAGTAVSLTGYNSGTQRQNLFNQTDVVFSHATGDVEHTWSAGVEVGRQATDNRRLTAFFTSISQTTTAITVPVSNPTTSLPVTFRAAATDANNHGVAVVAAAYAQDQIALSPHLRAILGVRFDRFSVDFVDRRNGAELTSTDGLVSPRVAVVYKPNTPVSIYASYTRSYLPRAGEQLSSLSPTNEALDPENFRNVEVGAKWEIARALSFTAALYRLDHGNVVVRDPLDPTVSHLVDAERSDGLELELTGRVTERWNVHGGYAFQNGEITRSLSATVLAGARLAQVPRHSFSLWNRYDVSRVWAVALGVISRGDSYVATDNTVVLPGFTRLDAGVFYTFNEGMRAHLNVENLLDERYYWSAHNNNNIAPGSPRALRLALTTRF
jgi:catecholate siderophore receptor